MIMRALYLTPDGLLEPLGYGQVVRVVLGLARRGIQYRILSLERPRDVARTDAVARLKGELAEAGVSWEPLRYDSSGRWATALGNVARMVRTADRLAREVEVVHARGYHSAFAGLLSPRRLWTGRPPLLFDTRAYWFDERREQGRWFDRDLLYRSVKQVERQMYARSAGVVTLTALSADDIRSGRLGPVPARVPVEVIPTVVDFDAFEPRRRDAARARLAARFPTLGDGPVVGFVGSINSWYRVDDSLALVAAMVRRDPSVRFVGLSAAHEELERRLERLGVPAHARLCTRVDHADMPSLLPALDWGLMLLVDASFAKRASMPTKLGEFLAAGVAPIHTGCNAEVGRWVEETGSGISLAKLEPADLPGLAERLLTRPPTEEARLTARDRAREHFGLDRAIDRYARLLERVAGAAKRAAP